MKSRTLGPVSKVGVWRMMVRVTLVLSSFAILGWACRLPAGGEGSAAGASPAPAQGEKLATLGGAEAEYTFYKEVLQSPRERVGQLNADELASLWETAFVYRDRQNAGVLANALAKAERRFWQSCFSTLAKGRDSEAVSLEAIKDEDVPAVRITMFSFLFSMKELRSCRNKRVLLIAEDLANVVEAHNAGEAPTVYDAFIETTSPSFLTYRGYPSSQAESFFLLTKRYEAAILAYKSCDYNKADGWVQQVISEYQAAPIENRCSALWRYLPVVLYYSGRSIYAKNDGFCVTDDGTILCIGNGEHKDEEIDLVLRLSQEKSTLIQRKTRP